MARYRVWWQRWLMTGSGFSLGLGLMGCPQASLGGTPADPGLIPVVQTAVLEPPTPTPPRAGVDYEICAEVEEWTRPDRERHLRELAQNPRYGEDLDQEPLQSLSEQFWHQPIIAFTTYGLSARMEPVNLSGLWTVGEAMDSCHGGDRSDAINQGTLGELWIIGHRVTQLEWVEGQYVVTVVPTGKGVQFMQFPRQEQEASLPLVVRTVEGQALSVVSGDW